MLRAKESFFKKYINFFTIWQIQRFFAKSPSSSLPEKRAELSGTNEPKEEEKEEEKEEWGGPLRQSRTKSEEYNFPTFLWHILKFNKYILCPFPPLIAGDEKWLEYPAMNASFVQDPPLPLFFWSKHAQSLIAEEEEEEEEDERGKSSTCSSSSPMAENTCLNQFHILFLNYF